MAKHTLTCAGCGAAFVAGRRTAKWCIRCKDPRNQKRDLGRLAEIDSKAAAVAQVALEAPSGVEVALRPLRIACALGLSSDLDLALAAAGVDAQDPTAPGLIEEARRRYPEVVAGEPMAFQNLQRIGAAQAAISVLASASTLPPAQAANAQKAAMQALELAQQGAAKVFTKTIVNISITPV